MDILLAPLFAVLQIALQLYSWVVVVAIILSWLQAFHVVNNSNQFVALVGRFVFGLTEPVLQYIRRGVPSVGGIDPSPVVLFLAIFFIQRVLTQLQIRLL